jgi:SHS2 domain-containing protein
MAFEFLDHTADIKVKAWGKTIDSAFSEVVRAFSAYVSKEGEIKDELKKEIVVSGSDRKSMLYNLVDELIYLLDAERFVVSRGIVKVGRGKLKATLYGDNVKGYKGLDHVKAATYAEMFVGKKKGRYEIVMVWDI